MSSSSDTFYGGFLVGILVAMVALAVTPITDGVTERDWRAAEQACSNANGVVKVYRPGYFGGKYEILCLDGRTVTLLESGRKYQ